MADAMSSSPTSPTPGARRRSTSGGAASRIAASFRGPTQPGSSRRASVSVMPISPASAMASIWSVSVIAGPPISSSRWTLPVSQKWKVPVPAPTDIRSVSVPLERCSRPDVVDRPLHLPGGAAGAALVLGSVEQEEQRVAAPLEEAGAPVVRLVEQRAEHAVEGVAHQLRADLALAGRAAR